MLTLLAEVMNDPTSFSGWFSAMFEIAQRLGIGATVVLGVGYYLLFKDKKQQADDWKLLQVAQTKEWKDLLMAKDAQLASDVLYSRDRDKQTLTLLGELAKVIEKLKDGQNDEAGLAAANRQELMGAVRAVGTSVEGLSKIIMDHVIKEKNRSS